MSHLLKEYRGKVDLIYIDTPFDSKADYKKKIKVKGKEVSTDSLAFEEKQYGDIWTNDEYLQFMYERLILCKELLSDTGSIYVHCDWHKSAYLKCVLDSIFGQDNFRNEIIWCYKTSLRCSDKSFGRDHDNILFYSKTNYSRIHTDKTDFPVSESTIKRWSAYADENGFVSNKHFAGSNSTIMNTEDETKGFNINNGIPRDWWEISSNVSKGNTNEVFAGKYPTQKPEALLERIIKASSNEGDLDGRMVKIMPVNRIATKADLKELIANLPYKTFEQRKEENPSDPVERITLVCMGHEPDLKDLYGDDSLTPDDLIFNQRFKKLCRLSQIGVYVDEAHHLFGADLEKAIRNKSDTSLRNTINQLSKELSRNGTSVIACYNYTGTPYIKNSILPEVVYSYGLNEAISNEYLKDISLKGYDNVKNEEFLRDVIEEFWQIYGENTFEGLLPKLAIFGSNIEEIENEIKPIIEKILYELNIPISKILVNVGDNKITKSEDIRNFNNLDNVGTEGNKKQFLLLVNKGREGWNCRSLFGVAMYRTPKSKVFILQATMRCLRQITNVQQKAKVFLSKENMDILDNELNQNFRMTLDDLSNNDNPKKEQYHVRMLPPERYITLKSLQHIYSISKKDYCNPIDFNLKNTDFSKYQSLVYEKSKLSSQGSIKVINADNLKDSIKYSQYMLICEISRYLNIKCSIISKILNEALDGISYILELINKYNDIIYDIIIPKIFESLYDISVEVQSKDKKVVLLREPKDKGYYNFNALPELVVSKDDFSILQYKERSFHADIYCFDSEPKKLCFYQYIWNLEKVKNVYFTGMFTNHQGELYIPYYDPDSKCVRNYYPDFIAEMTDGTIQLIEVKGDNKIDDIVVKAKANATIEVASKSNMEYVIYKSSDIMKNNIFENNDLIQHNLFTD